MKKLMIIAIVAALAVPTLAAPFLGGGQNEWVGATETVGTVPVKMEIAKYCAITLPDQIVLTEAVGQSWGNEWGGEDDGSIVTNFDVTLEATIVEDGVADRLVHVLDVAEIEDRAADHLLVNVHSEVKPNVSPRVRGPSGIQMCGAGV